MSTRLVNVRKATTKERKQHGADVVFVREDSRKRKYTIYGCKCYESWQQWGESVDVLGDNVEDIEEWRRDQDERR